MSNFSETIYSSRVGNFLVTFADNVVSYLFDLQKQTINVLMAHMFTETFFSPGILESSCRKIAICVVDFFSSEILTNFGLISLFPNV